MSELFKHRNLPHLLLSARETLMLRFRPLLLSTKLNEQQWRVLRRLDEVGYSDAARLAQQTQILAPSLTRMLRSLEEAGLISRTSDQRDLRRQVIRLSPEGYKVVAQLTPKIEAIYEQIEQEIGLELMNSLYQNLDIMSKKLRPHSNPASLRDTTL